MIKEIKRTLKECLKEVVYDERNFPFKIIGIVITKTRLNSSLLGVLSVFIAAVNSFSTAYKN